MNNSYQELSSVSPLASRTEAPECPNIDQSSRSGVPRGGGRGGHGPWAQAFEGAPGQLVGANFKKKTRPIGK